MNNDINFYFTSPNNNSSPEFIEDLKQPKLSKTASTFMETTKQHVLDLSNQFKQLTFGKEDPSTEEKTSVELSNQIDQLRLSNESLSLDKETANVTDMFFNVPVKEKKWDNFKKPNTRLWFDFKLRSTIKMLIKRAQRAEQNVQHKKRSVDAVKQHSFPSLSPKITKKVKKQHQQPTVDRFSGNYLDICKKDSNKTWSFCK